MPEPKPWKPGDADRRKAENADNRKRIDCVADAVVRRLKREREEQEVAVKAKAEQEEAERKKKKKEDWF
jgi:hypothetical protein